MIYCKSCNNSKSESEFYKRKNGKFETGCKECRKANRGTKPPSTRVGLNKILMKEGKRQCIRCMEIKTLDLFGMKNRTTYRPECKKCRSKERYTELNKCEIWRNTLRILQPKGANNV